MLRELHISNLAVIADARIDLAPGLNCFTGITGAGKSLVIGAVELLLGLRSPGDMLRAGADEGRVSGLFEVQDERRLKLIGEACDLCITDDGGEVLLTRRLYASGRSSVSLNGNPITLAMLKRIAEALVDVHGQHDHQYLLRPANQLAVIDEFAELQPARDAYASAYKAFREVEQKIESLRTGAAIRSQQLDLATYQLNEIDAAELKTGEYEALTARAQILNNLEKLKKDAGAVHSAIYESEGAVLDRLQVAASVLAELAMVDGSLNALAESVRATALQLSESAFDLGRYLGRLDLDPAEAVEVNDRLNAINRIINKYGPTVEATLELREHLAAQVAALESGDNDIGALQKQIGPLSSAMKSAAASLGKQRRAAAKSLKPRIEAHLRELGMDKAQFAVQLTDTDAGPSGTDDVEFLVRTNPGLPEAPLRKVASGGELSRIMLALKSVLAAGDRVSVLVFDEIDSNIGGRLGSVIGQKLRALAAHHQVLCITHLPQIACYADRQLTVRKEQKADATNTTVRPVSGNERIEEIAEMIGGHRVTETTRAQARELLEAAAPVSKSGSKRRAQSA